MAKARPIPDLAAEDAYAAAAAKIVAVRSQELADHSRDVLDLDDIERVHDMRVATRRLRAALEIFAPCFPKKAHRATLEEIKKLADALGERRDRDVTIAALESFAGELATPDRRGIASLVAVVRAEQREANAALAPHVGAERVAAVLEQLRELVLAAESAAQAPPGAAIAAASLARESGGNPTGGSVGNGSGDPARVSR
jgi:CHAD domain-containing protein